MSQIDDYSIVETKKMIVRHMIQVYEISEQEALDSLKNIVIRVNKMFPCLSFKEILIILYLSIYIE